jgi:hypothetical protein
MLNRDRLGLPSLSNRALEGVVSHSVKYAERPDDKRRGSLDFGILVPLFALLLAIGLAFAHWAGVV